MNEREKRGTAQMSQTVPSGDVRFFRDFVEGRPGEILDAALAVFADEGYDRGTMRQIAARVGVSEPALYRHFASKEDLFDRFVQLAGERQLEQVAEILATVDPASFPGDVLQRVESHRRRMAGAAPVLKVLVTEALRRPSVLDSWRVQFVAPLRNRIAEVVRRADAHYGILVSEQEFEGRLRFIMGALQGYLITSLLFGDAGSDVYLATAMHGMGWDCCRPPA